MAQWTAFDITRALEAQAEDRRPLVRRLEREAPVEALIEVLRMETSPLVRQVVCDVLGRRRAKTAVAALAEALSNPSAGVRGSASDALGKIGDPAAGAALADAFRAEVEPGLKAMHAAALGSARHFPAVPDLVTALYGESDVVRRMAARALGRMQARGALPDLRSILLREENPATANEIERAITEVERATVG